MPHDVRPPAWLPAPHGHDGHLLETVREAVAAAQASIDGRLRAVEAGNEGLAAAIRELTGNVQNLVAQVQRTADAAASLEATRRQLMLRTDGQLASMSGQLELLRAATAGSAPGGRDDLTVIVSRLNALIGRLEAVRAGE